MKKYEDLKTLNTLLKILHYFLQQYQRENNLVRVAAMEKDIVTVKTEKKKELS